MEDVLSVYARPYDPTRPLACLDEKSKELHGEMREPLPPMPGKAKRVDSEYARNGVANLFLWLEPLTGKRGVLRRPSVAVPGDGAPLCDGLCSFAGAFVGHSLPPSRAGGAGGRQSEHAWPA